MGGCRAHEVASQKQHKSISATDVLKALELVEFGDIAKNIQGELQGTSLFSIFFSPPVLPLPLAIPTSSCMPIYHLRPVYRDLQKSDKRKGGKGKAKDTSESASTASRAKGKGKASASAASGGATDQADTIPPIHLPRPSTSAAVASTDPSSEAENDNDNGRSEDVDEDQEMLDQDQEQDPEDDEDEEMDEDEDEGEEPEPLEDRMALEEEELRKDAKGLEGKAQADDAIEED